MNYRIAVADFCTTASSEMWVGSRYQERNSFSTMVDVRDQQIDALDQSLARLTYERAV